MNKREFLEILRRELRVLLEPELHRQLTYYDEMLTDMIEDGMAEEVATAKMGDPVDVARKILADMPVPPHMPPISGPTQPPKKTDVNKASFWVIFALILGFPIWFSVAVAALAVVIAVFAVVLALVISMVAVVIALIVGGLGLLVSVFFATGITAPTVLLLIGAGLLMIGLGILSVFAVYYLGKGLGFLVKKSVQFCSNTLKKEGSK